jgi:hypothetical protein
MTTIIDTDAQDIDPTTASTKETSEQSTPAEDTAIEMVPDIESEFNPSSTKETSEQSTPAEDTAIEMVPDIESEFNPSSTKETSEQSTPSENTTIEMDPANESEFNRSTIDKLGDSVRLTDSDEQANLQLFCYLNCGPDDSEELHKCRGVVFSGQQIVMKAFPYTIELSQKDKEPIRENIEPIFSQCSFYDAHEGALVRMFNSDGIWYTCTHRKLNAFRSKWASRESFGVSFQKGLESEIEFNSALRESLPTEGESAIERLQTTLDPTKQYMFLIRNNSDNRIVCAPPERPTIYHVGTFVNGELVMSENINVPYPTKHNFDNINHMYEYVNKVCSQQLQGIIIFAPENKQYKILTNEYQDLFQIRGNEPSIKFRYLQVRMDRIMSEKLLYLYPDSQPIFEDYENTIYEISKQIYSAYVSRYIKKQYIIRPKEEFAVMKECHLWHEEDRLQHKMTQNVVITIMNTQTPTALNKMIRRFKTEDITKLETVNSQPIRSNSKKNTRPTTSI